MIVGARIPATGRLWGLALGALLLAGAFLASLAVGARPIPLSEVLAALFAPDDSEAHLVVRAIRLPRSLMGLELGAALGVAGALIQALTRNPLADPGILGVNAGAGFAVLLATGFLGVTALSGAIWFAFPGALAATVITYAVAASGRGGASPAALTLAGIALGAVLAGFSTALVLMDPASFDRMRHWSAGSLAGATTGTILIVLPFVLAGLALAAVLARALDTVAMGDDLATALGTNVARLRLGVVVAVTLLAGAATAGAGPVAFVGLMVPHLARWWMGPEQRWILALSALLGPVVVLAADVAGRVVLAQGEVPVSVMTAFIGAPVLIALARQTRLGGP